MFREAPRGLAYTARAPPPPHPFCSQLRRPTTISDLPRSRTDTRPSFLYLFRVARLPYEWRRLMPECLKRGIWEPEDRRVLVPKIYGRGYGVNLHAVACRLRLVRLTHSET